MNCRRSPLISLGLSFVAMAWGILPPPLCHTHDGGDDGRHHHGVQAEFHSESGGHHHPHEHVNSSADVVIAGLLSPGNSTPHIHWALLGFHFSLPVPGDGDKPDDCGSTQGVLLRPFDELQNLDLRGSPWVSVAPAASPGSARRFVCPYWPPPPPTNLIASLPLCDSARLERSGVLLA
jgi:hypothetical protein